MKRIKVEDDFIEPVPKSIYFCLGFGILVGILLILADIIKIRAV